MRALRLYRFIKRGSLIRIKDLTRSIILYCQYQIF